MDERQIGLALTLSELGVSDDVSGFDSRLILQKTVYLIEEAGIRLGYGFNWYLRGPYSPSLARDLFGLASSKEDVVGWVLDGQSRKIVQRFRQLFENVLNKDLSTKARRLELLASIHYLARRQHLNPSDYLQATEQLAHNGKHFSNHEVAAAIQCLQGLSLL